MPGLVCFRKIDNFALLKYGEVAQLVERRIHIRLRLTRVQNKKRNKITIMAR